MLPRTVDSYRHKRQKSVAYTCRLFGISRQGLYQRKGSDRRKLAQAIAVVDKVRQIRRTMPRLGTRKLHHLLSEDCPVGRDKLFVILKSNHLLVKPHRSYHTTTNSKHMFRRHKNLIVDLPILRPEQVWVSDITYIGNQGHNHYLALITDAYSKKIVGYDLSQSLAAEGAVRALKMALKTRKSSTELIHHSDRGIQYYCDTYQRVLEKAKVSVSMTQNGDPLENAIAERINGILKQEFELVRWAVDTAVLKRIVTQSVAIYNNLRPHLSCRLLTPEKMHLQNEVPRATYHKKVRCKQTLAPNDSNDCFNINP